MRIAYLGPPGTFTHHALIQSINHSTTEINYHQKSTFNALFNGLNDHSFDCIFVPIENSIEGPVNHVIDFLAKHNNYQITGSITMPIKQCLLGKRSIAFNQISHVISMPHAIAQCQNFLQHNCPTAVIHHSTSTASAVDMLNAAPFNESNTVIIGHKGIVHFSQLTIIQENIHDQSNNATEFYFIQKNTMNNQTNTNHMTSLNTLIGNIFDADHAMTRYGTFVCSTKKDEPGSLGRVLKIVEDNNINLTKIISRPEKSNLGEYLFIIEYALDSTTKTDDNMLTNIQQHTLFYTHLGHYRKGLIHD